MSFTRESNMRIIQETSQNKKAETLKRNNAKLEEKQRKNAEKIKKESEKEILKKNKEDEKMKKKNKTDFENQIKKENKIRKDNDKNEIKKRKEADELEEKRKENDELEKMKKEDELDKMKKEEELERTNMKIKEKLEEMEKKLIIKEQNKINKSLSPSSKRKPFSKPKKLMVWNYHLPKHSFEHKCPCCKDTTITRYDYECGHILSHKNGGSDEITNLKPICSTCNKSMGSKHMLDFIHENGFYL